MTTRGAPPSGGDWWQDHRGKWQKGPQPQAVKGAGPGVSRLDQIVEQIGHLDGASKFLGRREIRELPSILWEDETVEKLIQGTYDGSNGVLVATNKRLVFVDKGIAKLRVEDFPYDKVTSIQYKTGMLMGTITIFASGNRAEIQNVVKDSCKSAFQNEAVSRRAALCATIAASSVASIAGLSRLPASLRSHHPAHPADEASF